MRQLEALSINGWYERERIALLMATLEFSYSRFWDSFRNNGHGIADDAAITIRVFDADYKAMKRQRGTCVPFVTRNMSAFKVTDSRMLCHPDSTDRFALYEHGMYAVLEQVALQRSQDARDQDREQWKRMHDRAIRRKANNGCRSHGNFSLGNLHGTRRISLNEAQIMKTSHGAACRWQPATPG
jgi:hypothetical protein